MKVAYSAGWVQPDKQQAVVILECGHALVCRGADYEEAFRRGEARCPRGCDDRIGGQDAR